MPEEGVEKQAVDVALGITRSGERMVLGFWIFPPEGASVWASVPRELRARGLKQVLLVIADGLRGREEAIRNVSPGSEWQRCVGHAVRESLGQVRAQDRGVIAAERRGIDQARSRREALERLETFTARWGGVSHPGGGAVG